MVLAEQVYAGNRWRDFEDGGVLWLLLSRWLIAIIKSVVTSHKAGSHNSGAEEKNKRGKNNSTVVNVV